MQHAIGGRGSSPHIGAERGDCLMSILGWILLGLVAGFIGGKIVNRQGQGMLMDIVLGIVGAIVGGLVFSLFGATGVTGFNIYSLIVAVIGSVVVLWLYHMLLDRPRPV
jgi:uncharacterized membrane protein YeaQ/YmgE (transglycosylase-associated protein family)